MNYYQNISKTDFFYFPNSCIEINVVRAWIAQLSIHFYDALSIRIQETIISHIGELARSGNGLWVVFDLCRV